MADGVQPDHEWREASPGRYERDLDEVELFYATLAKLYEGTGHSFFAITGYLEVLLDLSPSEDLADIEQRVENAFRAAWRRLCSDHPTIASFVEYDRSTKTCRKVYERFKSDDQSKGEPEWLESSFKTIDNNQSGLEFANADPPIQQHATLYLIKPPVRAEASSSRYIRRDVVFRCPHVTIDGIGTLMLLDNLMAHTAKAYKLQEASSNISPEPETSKLSPPLRIAASIPSNASPIQLDRLSETNAAESALRKDVELLSIPFNRDAILPRESRRVAIHLGKKEARGLSERCKALGISVTHAFHAGIVLALRNIAERRDRERNARYVNYCLVNLRQQCRPPCGSSRHAVSVYHSVPGNSLAIDVTIPAKGSPSPRESRSSDDFHSIVAQVKGYYLGVKSDLEFVAMTPLVFKGFTLPYPEELHCKVPPPNQSPSVSISSMGVIDNLMRLEHSPFTINAPWVTGNEYGTGVGVFLGSWRGEMSLSATFNVAFHEEAKILEFLNDTKNVVSVGLGI